MNSFFGSFDRWVERNKTYASHINNLSIYNDRFIHSSYLLCQIFQIIVFFICTIFMSFRLQEVLPLQLKNISFAGKICLHNNIYLASTGYG